MATTLDKYVQNRSGLTPVVTSEASDGSGDAVMSQADKADGAVHVKQLGSVAGAAAGSALTAVPAMIPEALTETIDVGPPVLTAQWVPLAEGVTVDVALGAGPVAAAAVGNAVSITALVAGVTTVGQVQAAIAAVPAVAALVRLDGTPADVYGAAYAGLATTALDHSRVGGMRGVCGFRPDGTWGPLRLDQNGHLVVDVEVGDEIEVTQAVAADLNCTEANSAAIAASLAVADDWDAVHDAVAGTDGVRQMGTAYADPSVLPADVSANGDDARVAVSRKGETFVYPSRLSCGERATATASGSDRMAVREEWALGSGGILAATGTAHNAPCRLACLILAETGGANPVTATIRDNGAGGTQTVPTIYCAPGQSREIWLAHAHGTDVHVTIAGAGTASCAVYYHP